MKLAEFIERRRPAWIELQDLLRQAERVDPGDLGPARARRLIDLYGRVSADLLRVRRHGGAPDVVTHLETLVARGHALVHPSPPLRAPAALLRFFRVEFPATVRAQAALIGLAAAALVLGGAIGVAAHAVDPMAPDLLVPGAFQHDASERVAGDERRARQGRARIRGGEHAAMSSYLFTHNIQVGIVSFAVGLAWGLPTLLLLAYNGAILGVVGAQYFADGVGRFFLAWVLPHGLLELTCIVISGAAGLALGRGVIWPRGRPRGERVREEARTALMLLGGAAALLVPTGIIEGTISQIHEPVLSYSLKIALAVILFAALQAYLWLIPLGARPPHAPTALRSR